jgi:hypothetical protein
MRMPSRARDMTGGMLGGLIGSAVMAVPILTARTRGIIGTPPPERITEGLLRRAGIPSGSKTRDLLSVLSHLAFGAAAGAAYGAVAPRLRDVPRAVLLGIGYATGIYLVSYAGWVPALGLLPPPDRDQPGRQGVMLVAHLLFGTAVGLGTLAGARSEGPAQPRHLKTSAGHIQPRRRTNRRVSVASAAIAATTMKKSEGSSKNPG